MEFLMRFEMRKEGVAPEYLQITVQADSWSELIERMDEWEEMAESTISGCANLIGVDLD